MKRYILVGGRYVGGGSFVGLRVVGSANTEDEAKTLTNKQYDVCGGLLLWIDTKTGKAGEPEGESK
jgi:hypothetical protein